MTHFLARFRQELKKTGDVPVSVTNSILSSGKAIIGTTIVLSMGFFVLYFSELVPNHEFGILATIILIIAMMGSLFLLPVDNHPSREGLRWYAGAVGGVIEQMATAAGP